MPHDEPTKARLLARADCSGGPDACWPWLGSLRKDGYGETRAYGQRRAHRAMWIAEHGQISSEWCVCHRCDNPPCINPAHLFVGTNADNLHDRHAKGRYATGDKHYVRLHPEIVRGERNGRAKLTAAEAAEIRAAYVPRYGAISALARRYGVSHGTVAAIIHNRRWRA